MITEYSVLQTDVQPEREIIMARDGELDHLSAVLEPITEGVAPNGAFIYGPSGAGKTTAVRCVTDELPRSVFVNCLSSHARRSVLNRVLSGIGGGSAIERQSVSTDDLAAQIPTVIDGPTVVVLDEADQLDDLTVLHELYGIEDLALVLISNDPWPAFDLERFDKESARLDSRIGALAEIEFKAYTDGELVSILEKRASVGVEPGVIDDSVLEHIARRADSDARDAIALLYHSVKHAELGGHGHVTKSMIDAAGPDADKHVVRSRLSDLTRGQRLALEGMADVGPATSGEVYKAYCERAEDPFHDRTVRGWLPKLERYELVEKSGPEHEPVYEVREIALKELGLVM